MFAGPFPGVVSGPVGSPWLFNDLALLSLPLLLMDLLGAVGIYLFHAVLQDLLVSLHFFGVPLEFGDQEVHLGGISSPQSCCNTSSAGAGGDTCVTEGCGCHSPAHTCFVAFRAVLSIVILLFQDFLSQKRFPGM